MKKSVLVICLVFLLTSCQAMTASESTATPAPTNTIIPATATSTVEPTSTSVPPTLTPTATLVNVDFEMPAAFAPFDTQFPLSNVNEFAGYILRCAVDGANIHTGNINLGDNLDMRAWASCYFTTPDGRTDFVNIPIYVVNKPKNQDFTAFFSDPQPLLSNQNGFSPHALDIVVPKWMAHFTSKKVFVMGFGFGSPSSADASQAFFASAAQKLSDDAAQKLADGDTSGLPTVGGVDHFLPAFEYLTDTVK